MRAGAAAYGAYEPPKIPYSGSIILAKIKKKVNSVIVDLCVVILFESTGIFYFDGIYIDAIIHPCEARP
jgi:hypothetical protein